MKYFECVFVKSKIHEIQPKHRVFCFLFTFDEVDEIFIPKCKTKWSRKRNLTRKFLEAGYVMADYARRTFSNIADFFDVDDFEDDHENDRSETGTERTSYDSYLSTIPRRAFSGTTVYLDPSYDSYQSSA